ncbi:MAG: hypothetical protein KBD90_01250 [Alphaproteobacteria bacterium]|nr:hypothetical protein [Alphaproteobacteria bacterium]
MNKPHKSFSVDECKIRASMLLKSLDFNDITSSQKAAKRFQRHPELKNLSRDEMIQTDVKRKHALAIIALEKGFKSWTDLKCQLPFIRGGFLNHWFANYADAKSYQQFNGGFLLPFKNQFFICDTDYIINLGFNAEDPDWTLIGYDWAYPDNKEAWQRLYKKWMKIQGAHHE